MNVNENPTVAWLTEHIVTPLARLEGKLDAQVDALREHKREDEANFRYLREKLDRVATAQAVAAVAGKRAGQKSGRISAAKVAAAFVFLFEVGRQLLTYAQAAAPLLLGLALAGCGAQAECRARTVQAGIDARTGENCVVVEFYDGHTQALCAPRSAAPRAHTLDEQGGY